MPAPNPAQALEDLRTSIDKLDRSIVDMLVARQACVRQIFAVKRPLGLDPIDPAREEAMITARRAYAASVGVSEDFAEAVFRLVLEESGRLR